MQHENTKEVKTERLLAKSSNGDDLAFRHRLSESPDVGRRMEAGCTLYGQGLANPGQSGKTQSPATTAEGNQILARGGSADEGGTICAGKKASHQGQLALLGETPPGGEGAISFREMNGLSIRQLRPSQLVRLLNATPLGSVLNERQLFRQRSQAGYQIGTDRRIDLVKYAAWLISVRQKAKSQELNGIVEVNTQTVMSLLQHQNYRCAMTGRQLTPQTSSLDHIIPVSRGRQHSINNAQVLHKDVNRAKGVLTNEQFIQLCREVVAYADRKI